MQQFGTITNDDILEYRQFVARLAHRVIIGKPYSVELDDLMQAGMMGLSEALQRFKPLPGVIFKAYASARIVGAMLDELRSYDWVPRSTRRAQRKVDKEVQHLQHLLLRAPSDGELAAALGMSLADFQKLTGQAHSNWVSLDDVLTSEAEPMDDDAGDGACLLQRPWTIDECSEPSAVLQRRQAYRGLVDAIAVLPEREREVLTLYYEEGLKLKQIGAMQGVTESRVCQLLAKTVGKLKSALDAADRPRQCTADSTASLAHRRRPVRATLSRPLVEGICDAVADQDNGQDAEEDGQTGQAHGPPGHQKVLPVAAHHQAPAHLVGVAQTQERHGRFEQDGVSSRQRGGDNKCRQGVG